MQYIVKGMYQMVVEASSWTEAKQTSERILRNDGIKVIALEATENGDGNGDKRRGDPKC